MDIKQHEVSVDVTQRVRVFVTANFYVPDPTALRDEDSLLDRGIIDSTGVLEVINFLETTFELTVEDEEMVPENLDSIAQISSYVGRKKALLVA